MNTQQKAIYNEMVAKAMTLSADTLMIEILVDVQTPKLPNEVFNSMMQALENIIGEEAFTEFCNTL